MKTFDFKLDFRFDLLSEKVNIYFAYLIPILNSDIIEKFRNVAFIIQDLLLENFSEWFAYENKDLVAASSFYNSLLFILIFYSFAEHICFAHSKKKLDFFYNL